MAKFLAVFVVLSCYYVAQISAYSGGAPTDVCDDMKPKHPVDPQSSEIPYKIDLSKNNGAPGQVIQVTVSGQGGKPFKGLLIQGRQGDQPVGVFKVASNDQYVKTIDCPNGKKNAVTHKNSEIKKSITVDYEIPQGRGEIQFFATVAENGGVFWVKKPLASLKIQ